MIAVILPCFKSKRFVLDVLRRIPECVTEIVVVDDACPEATGRHVEAHFHDSRLKVVYHERNLGVGGAMKTGMAEALKGKADVFVKIDSDGQMPPEILENFVRPILSGEADCCKGNRFYHLESLRGMPWIRVLGNSFLSFFSKLSTGYWQIMDPTNGYIALHRKVVGLLPMQKLDDRYFFETDLMFRLNTLSAVVLDVPMNAVYGEEESNLSVVRSLWTFLWKNLQCFGKRVFYNYLLRDFSIATLNLLSGLVLFLGGLVYGLGNYLHFSGLGTVTPTGVQVVTALLLLIGFQLLLSFITFDIARVPDKVIHPRLPGDAKPQ